MNESELADLAFNLTYPTVHLNGTSKEQLLQQYTHAHQALNEALMALSRAAPHGRDYYTQGPDAINEAIAQHNKRLNALRQVAQEILIIGLKIADQ